MIIYEVYFVMINKLYGLLVPMEHPYKFSTMWLLYYVFERTYVRRYLFCLLLLCNSHLFNLAFSNWAALFSVN